MEKAERKSRFVDVEKKENDLMDLRILWQNKKLTKDEIQKKVNDNWATEADYKYKGKKLFDYVTSISDDMDDSDENVFGQPTDFALYFDLETGNMIGPLSLLGLSLDENEKYDDSNSNSNGDRYDRWRDDAIRIRKYDKDPTKIQIYAK